MKKIITKHDPLPIPDRSLDWSAWVDGQDEDVTGWPLTKNRNLPCEAGMIAEGQTELEACRVLAGHMNWVIPLL